MKSVKSSPVTGRSDFIDFLKGIAIYLMIFAHCIEYGSGKELMKHYAFTDNFFFRLINSFHMPLFAAISGYLVYYSLKKYPLEKLIALLGRYTLAIYAFDMAANEIMMHLTSSFEKPSFIMWVIESTIIAFSGLGIALILNRFKVTKILFLGKLPRLKRKEKKK